MGVDRIVNCFLGFEIDNDKLYENEEVELDPLPNCDHGYPGKLKDKHCRECGMTVHTEKRHATVVQLKDEVIKAIVPKYRDFGDDYYECTTCLFSGHDYVMGKINNACITMFQTEFEKPFVVAGVCLVAMDVMHDGVVSEKTQWIDEKKLASFLRKKKIPFKKGTFRIYALMELC